MTTFVTQRINPVVAKAEERLVEILNSLEKRIPELQVGDFYEDLAKEPNEHESLKVFEEQIGIRLMLRIIDLIMLDEVRRTEDCLKSEREVKCQLVEEKNKLENEVTVLKEEILHLKVLVPEDKKSLKVPSKKEVPGNSSKSFDLVKEQMYDLTMTPQKNDFQVSDFLNISPIITRGRGCRKQSNVTEATNEVAIIADTEEEDSVSLLSIPTRKEVDAEEQVKEQKLADPPVKKSKFNDDLSDHNKPSFCHVGPAIRTQEGRKKMPGFDCRECSAYYNMKMQEGLTIQQIHSVINKCSRHRAHHKPSKTPEKFWDADIIEGDPDSPRNKTHQGPPLKSRAMRREAWRKLNFGN